MTATTITSGINQSGFACLLGECFLPARRWFFRLIGEGHSSRSGNYFNRLGLGSQNPGSDEKKTTPQSG